MIVLVTGSRDWPEEDAEVISDVLFEVQYYNPDVREFHLLHGNARGVDTFAKKFAADNYKWTPYSFTPRWLEHGKGAGFIRNQLMVDTAVNGTDNKKICVVFRKDQSRGATDCGERAEKAGIETIWIDYEDLDS